MFWEIVFLIVGLVMGVLILMYRDKKNKGIGLIKGAIKNKEALIFLESGDATFLTRLIGRYHNLGITEQKELVILSPNSLKHCSALGIFIGHGDLYKSVIVPKEVMNYKNELKSKYGLSDEDIGEFLKAVETMNKDDLKKNNILNGKIEPIKEGETPKETLYNLYVTMPSIVSNFVNTGLNRALIFSMLRNLVAQRELERMNQKNWKWLIYLGILILLGGLAFQFAAPMIAALKGGAAAAPAASGVATMLPQIGLVK